MSKLFSDMRKIWKCNLGFYSKNLVFYLFHELGKIQPKQHSKIPKSHWEESGSTAKDQHSRNPNLESMEELGKFISISKFQC